MLYFKNVERLSLILRFVNANRFPSLEAIMEYLSANDLLPTERTLQRDLKTLRDLCYIEIKYNRIENGYFIDEESMFDFEEWMHVFELFNTAQLVSRALVDSAKNVNYIDFDRSKTNRGNELMEQLLEAVLKKNTITFEHHNFWKQEVKHITLYPYLLKQYQNRWYVFGELPNGEYRSYGLERIQQLSTQTDTFKPKLKKPKDAFDEIIGMVYSLSDKERVVLSYSAAQGNYIKTQPLHTSQQVLIDTEEEFRISIHVRPNYELQEQILKQGERVFVVEPVWLKEVIKERLLEAVGRYSQPL